MKLSIIRKCLLVLVIAAAAFVLFEASQETVSILDLKRQGLREDALLFMSLKLLFRVVAWLALLMACLGGVFRRKKLIVAGLLIFVLGFFAGGYFYHREITLHRKVRDNLKNIGEALQAYEAKQHAEKPEPETAEDKPSD